MLWEYIIHMFKLLLDLENKLGRLLEQILNNKFLSGVTHHFNIRKGITSNTML